MIRTARSTLVVVLLAGLLAGCSGEPARGPAQQASGPAVDIDRIGVRSDLVSLGSNPDRTVRVPPLDRVEQAGFYAGGPVPGDVGPAVIIGHVNGRGRPGVFARLHELVVGDEVMVTRDGRPLTFTVRRVQTVAKERFPTAEVYSDVATPELRIVTCGGDLDRTARSYRANVIVFATLAP